MAEYDWLIDNLSGKTNEPPREYVKEAAAAIKTLQARAEKAEGERDAAVQVLAKCLHDCAMYSADPIARIEVCLRNRPEVAVLVDAALAALIEAQRERQARGRQT